jgi:hypothetical protein
MQMVMEMVAAEQWFLSPQMGFWNASLSSDLMLFSSHSIVPLFFAVVVL